MRAAISIRWLGLTVVVAITFVLVRIAVLNVFYTTGDLHDPGWLATITWRNNWHLYGPPAFPGPYFSEHVSPILWVTNAISFIVPLAKFDYYAACIATIYALYAAGVYRAWQLCDARVTAAGTLVAILVALAATFGGIGVVALGLPHPEMAIPALALWFTIAVVERAYLWAGFWLAACLLVREDAGLHVFALLVLWAGVQVWRQRAVSKDIRWVIGFALAALGYSVLALLAKRLDFPASDNLTRAYLGSPAWHHVTVPFVLDRLRFYFLMRGYVTLPLLLTCIWAAITRNPLLPLGYIAALPWLVFSLLAVHATPGTLAYYYAFPFWLALAWPLIAMRLWADSSGRLTWRCPYALVLLTSVVAWRGDRLVIYPLDRNSFGDAPFVYNDTLRDRAAYQAFADYFVAHRPLFGTTALDEAVFGLLIDQVDRKSWLEDWRSNEAPETLIYFNRAFDWRPRVLPLLQTGVYHCVYAVPGTRIRIATRNPLSDDLPVPMPIMLINSLRDTQC
jgi:hypothetical protein